jgi:four helix bundle protein
MASIKSLDDFQTWQKSKEVNKLVAAAVNCPEFQNYLKLKNQIINSSMSVMANLAEGFGRQGNAEFIQFISIAIASSAELRSHIQGACDFSLINKEKGDEIISKANEVEARAFTLMKKIKSSSYRGLKYK